MENGLAGPGPLQLSGPARHGPRPTGGISKARKLGQCSNCATPVAADRAAHRLTCRPQFRSLPQVSTLSPLSPVGPSQSKAGLLLPVCFTISHCPPTLYSTLHLLSPVAADLSHRGNRLSHRPGETRLTIDWGSDPKPSHRE
jgi:hypothetical protein